VESDELCLTDQIRESNLFIKNLSLFHRFSTSGRNLNLNFVPVSLLQDTTTGNPQIRPGIMAGGSYSSAQSATEAVMKALEGVPIKTPQLIGIILGCCVFLTTIGLVIFILVKSGTLAGAIKQLQEEASSSSDTKAGTGGAGVGSGGPTLFDRVVEKAAALPTKPSITTAAVNGSSECGSAQKSQQKNKDKDKDKKEEEAGLTLQEVSVVPLQDKHFAALWSASNGGGLFHESAYDARERIWERLDLSPVSVSCACVGALAGDDKDKDRDGKEKEKEDEARNSSAKPHLAQPTKSWPDESVDSFRNWFATAPADALHCAILDATLDTPVGMVSLVSNRPYDLTMSISNLWLTPAYQSLSTHAAAAKRPKYAHVVCYLLMKELFAQGYRRVTLQVPEKNNVMKRFLASCCGGLQLEGVLRKHRISQSRSQDVCVYSLVNAEWPAAELAWRIRLQLPKEKETGKETTKPQGMQNTQKVDSPQSKVEVKTQTKANANANANPSTSSAASTSPEVVRKVQVPAATLAPFAGSGLERLARNDGGDEFRNALRGLLPDELLDQPLPDMGELDLGDM